MAPQDILAGLHNSRVVNDAAARLTAELAALGGSKGNLLKLADAQQQMQTAQQQMLAAEAQMRASEQQLSASEDRIRTAQQQGQAEAATLGDRLAALEKTVAADGAQLVSLKAALPRRVETLAIGKADSSLVTGSIAASPATFAAPRPAPSPATAPTEARVAQPMPAAVPPPISAAAAPARSAAGPQWLDIAALPAFSTPNTLQASADAAAATAAPYPMAPRWPTDAGLHDSSMPASVASAGAIAAPAHRPKPDVKAIGVAIGNPVTPASALASWQQIAENVGVLLVGTSPLLADDPAGSAGKVLVAGPLPGIAAATALCGKIEAASLSCTPMPYVGTELNAATSYQGQ